MKKQKVDLKSMSKEEREEYLKKMKIKRKRDTVNWFKNIGKSIDQLWQHIGDEIATMKVVDVAGRNLLDKKKRKKLMDLARIKKLSKENVKELKQILLDELGLDELHKGTVYLGKEIFHRVSTGKLLENRNRQETARSNKDERDFNDLLDRLEKLDDLSEEDLKSAYESSIGGGIMLKEKLEMSKLRLTQYGYSENFVGGSQYKNTINVVNQLVDRVLAKVALCESLDKDEINDLEVNEAVDTTKAEIITLATVLRKDKGAEMLFNERLGDSYNTLVEAKAVYDLSEVNDENIDKVLEDIRRSNDEANEVGGVFGDRVSEVLEDDENTVEDNKDDYVFDPVVDEDKIESGELVPVAEKRKAKGESVELAAGISIPLLGLLVMVAANSIIRHSNNNFASKFGANSGVKQPMVVSKSLSKGLVAQLSKAMEVKYALQVKALLESSMSAMDGGMVNKRLRLANFASSSKIDVKDVKLFARKVLSYDDVLSVFSEGKVDTDYVGFFTTDDLYFLPAVAKVFSEKYIQDTIMMRTALSGTGEAGIQLEEKRSALPTYITVSINHDTFDGKGLKTVKNETILGVEINPKMVSSEDLIETIKTNSFAKIKVTKDERTMMQRIKDMVNFWKNRPAKTESDKKINLVSETKTFYEIASKVKNIKTPLFHIMMSQEDAADLKAKGIDVFKNSDYSKLMERLPIISISVVNEDSGIILMSEGKNMAYIKKDIEDFVDSTARLEKELRSEIKFRNNL